MVNDAWEKDPAAHKLFEQAKAAFNEARIEAEEGLKTPPVGRWQPRRLDDALAREWRAVEQMEAAIELLLEGLLGVPLQPLILAGGLTRQPDAYRQVAPPVTADVGQPRLTASTADPLCAADVSSLNLSNRRTTGRLP